MDEHNKELIGRAKKTALDVLLHNNHGPYRGLPRTAAWGYPEPYTRDLMIASLGVMASGNKKLIKSLKRVLETTARNQNRLGHISSLVHDPDDRGSSDCTPLFLMATGIWRKATGEKEFLRNQTLAQTIFPKSVYLSFVYFYQSGFPDIRHRDSLIGWEHYQFVNKSS